MKNILNIVLVITALTAVFVMAYFSSSFLSLKTKEIENEAKFTCTQSSRYQTTDPSGAIVWYPVEEMYQKCLKEKGF